MSHYDKERFSFNHKPYGSTLTSDLDLKYEECDNFTFEIVKSGCDEPSAGDSVTTCETDNAIGWEIEEFDETDGLFDIMRAAAQVPSISTNFK